MAILKARSQGIAGAVLTHRLFVDTGESAEGFGEITLSTQAPVVRWYDDRIEFDTNVETELLNYTDAVAHGFGEIYGVRSRQHPEPTAYLIANFGGAELSTSDGEDGGGGENWENIPNLRQLFELNLN